jgi:FkbM family methyltransferase
VTGNPQQLVASVLRPAYALFLRTVFGRAGLPWSVNGEVLRIDPRVRRFVPHHSEPALFQYLRSAIQPGETVLDIGAFLGTYAVMAARWTGPLGRVLAFEPSPATFQILQRHLVMNKLCAPRVEARCAAVGARVGRHCLKQYEFEPYRNQIVADDLDDSAVMVEIVTVDSVCVQWKRVPNWIRLDVQGLEFEVLEGAREVIREGRGRLKIVAEMHPHLWPDYGIRPREVVERLAALGLRARGLTPSDSFLIPDSHMILESL